MKFRIREDKDAGPKCPFCERLLIMPETVKTATGEFVGGRCECGAAFACDPTGHNVGEAYLDAIMYASGAGLDADYREAVFNYDINTHRLWHIKDIRRDYSGKIVFVKVIKQNNK